MCSRELHGSPKPGTCPTTSYLIDINLWLALTWDQHSQHAAAARWYDSLDEAMLLFGRFTMLGFLRPLTNRRVMGGAGRGSPPPSIYTTAGVGTPA